MSTVREEQLLWGLQDADPETVDRVFRHYEPFLRIVVRRMIAQGLRSKLDSLDVVQSVWADVWEGIRQRRWHFEHPDEFKAFLTTAVRNRLIDQSRKHRRALQLETPLEYLAEADLPGQSEPPASQVVEADELWQQMIDRCSPQQREILTMKRSGASLERIAHSQGMHISSVRRVLYQLARRLMGRLPASTCEAAKIS